MSEESHQAASKNTVNGIEGPSWLGGLKYHGIIEGTGLEYRHCVLVYVTVFLDLVCFWKNNRCYLQATG